MYAHVRTQEQFSIASPPTDLFLGGGKKIGEPGGNPCKHEDDMRNSTQTVTQAQDRIRKPGSAGQRRYTPHHYLNVLNILIN